MKHLYGIFKKHRFLLVSGFESAIRIAMHDALTRVRGRSPRKIPEEPDIIAMLVLESTRYIASTINSVMPSQGFATKISSVFCHQVPKVTFAKPSGPKPHATCELGDILFVHVHSNTGTGKISFNSLLLQAKRCPGSVHTPRGSAELAQLYLYTDWPTFKYVSSGPALNHQQRSVKPPTAHQGAQYLFIDDSVFDHPENGLLGYPGTFCMGVHPAMPRMIIHRSLAEVLCDFLVRADGRSFLPQAGVDPTGWSDVVLDLLQSARTATFNRKNCGIKSAKRSSAFFSWSDGRDLTLALTREDAIDAVRDHLSAFSGAPPEEPVDVTLGEDAPSGCSVILIETQENRSE